MSTINRTFIHTLLNSLQSNMIKLSTLYKGAADNNARNRIAKAIAHVKSAYDIVNEITLD